MLRAETYTRDIRYMHVRARFRRATRARVRMVHARRTHARAQDRWNATLDQLPFYLTPSTNRCAVASGQLCLAYMNLTIYNMNVDIADIVATATITAANAPRLSPALIRYSRNEREISLRNKRQSGFIQK